RPAPPRTRRRGRPVGRLVEPARRPGLRYSQTSRRAGSCPRRALLVLVDGDVHLGLAGDALRVLAGDRGDEVVFGLVDVRGAHALLFRRAVAEVPLALEGSRVVLDGGDELDG